MRSLARFLFGTDGRLARVVYLPAVIGLYGCLFAASDPLSSALARLGGVGALDTPATSATSAMSTATASVVLAACLILYATVLAAILCLSIRRLHDFDRSGRFLLLAAIPIVALHAFRQGDTVPPLGYVVCFLVLAIIPGSPGPNAYGAVRPGRG